MSEPRLDISCEAYGRAIAEAEQRGAAAERKRCVEKITAAASKTKFGWHEKIYHDVATLLGDRLEAEAGK